MVVNHVTQLQPAGGSMWRPEKWVRALLVPAVLAAALAAPAIARAQNPGFTLSQCLNGQSGLATCTGSAWHTGNAGHSNSRYREGDFVPFRTRITDLVANRTYTLRIGYDALDSGLHAYDYLGSVDGSKPPEQVVPCDFVGLAACQSAPSKLAVPEDTHTTFPSGARLQKPGEFSAWGAQLMGAAYVNPTPIGVNTPGYVERVYDVTFIAHGPTVVLAWGGHIASVLDWGAGRTFISAASGSSFHMRLTRLATDGQVFTTGNRELSLSASALAAPPTPFRTQVSRSPVDVGTTVFDTATLTGRPGDPVAGTVTFFVCFGATRLPCTTGGTEVGSRPVAATSATPSASGEAVIEFVPRAAGTYCFRAEFTPDATAPYSPAVHTNDSTECFEAVAGELQVVKRISGEAAGYQGEVVIRIRCRKGGTSTIQRGVPLPFETTFVIPAHAGRGSHTSPLFGPFPEGTLCTVDEVQNGHTTTIDVDVTGVPRDVEIRARETTTVEVDDEFTWIRGSLLVRKTIGGPSAGQHGPIRIEVLCNGRRLADFTIAEGQGTLSKHYEDILAGTTCRVREVANGATSSVQVIISGDRETTIPANDTGEIHLTDLYRPATAPPRGSLVVRKTIGGPSAGQHGPIRIEVLCNGQRLPDFTIEAGAGSSERRYENIPAPATCRVREVANGATSSVQVHISGNRETEIAANDTGEIQLTDLYRPGIAPPAVGSLVVRKTIAGGAAARRGPIRIQVICGNVRLDDFVIGLGDRMGTQSSAPYHGIPAGTTCTVSEIEDGSTGSVQVVVTGDRTTSIRANGTAAIDLTDTYTAVAPDVGSLVVTKTITGPAAGQQGAVTIGVTCGGKALPDFTIAGGAPSGESSRRYDDIPAGATCIVVERANGQTSTVAAAVTGSGGATVVPAGRTVTLAVRDSYSSEPGSLVVNKTITGPAAGQQGPVTIQVSCNGTLLPDLTILAGAAAGTTSHTYSGLPAGATCTLTELADGHHDRVSVAVSGDRQATISAGGATGATLVDTYTAAPGALKVAKTIAGDAAGSQGVVRIAVICGGVPQPDFVIPAGTAERTVSHTYTGITAGSACTVTEAADGQTNGVDVTVTGSNQTVTIPAGGTATAALTDRYATIPGALTVQKTIRGLGAARHSTIRIRVSCGGKRLPDLVIPAGTGPATVSHTYHGLQAAARCAITETPRPGNRITLAAGNRQVTIQANRHATFQITNTYLAAATRPQAPPPRVTG